MGALDLTPIKARAEAVASQSWHLDGPDYHFYGPDDRDYVNTSLVVDENRTGIARGVPPVISQEHLWLEWSPEAEANLEFIAHARTDVPALVAEVERLRADQALREQMDSDTVALFANLGDGGDTAHEQYLADMEELRQFRKQESTND